MHISRSTLIQIAAISGALAVIAGAFGAHALKEILDADQLMAYKTAVRYQMWHAIVILALGMGPVFDSKQGRLVGTLMLSGIILFSGSIYLLVMTGWGFLGPITPIGGLLFVASWVLLVVWVGKNKRIFNEK
ncbi:MAG: DUF423 domain-containing protein [Bacteroidia bacterium]